MGLVKHPSLERKKLIVINATTLTRTGAKRDKRDVAWDYGVSLRTIQRYVKQYNENGGFYACPARMGRPRTLSTTEEDVSLSPSMFHTS
jgi:transposase